FRIGPFTTLKLITEDDLGKDIIKQIERLMEQLGSHIPKVAPENLTTLKTRLSSILDQLDKVLTSDDLIAVVQDVIRITSEALSEPVIPEQREVQHLAESIKESSENVADPQESIL